MAPIVRMRVRPCIQSDRGRRDGCRPIFQVRRTSVKGNVIRLPVMLKVKSFAKVCVCVVLRDHAKLGGLQSCKAAIYVQGN